MRENNELASPGTQQQPSAHSLKEPTILGLARWTVTGGMRGKTEHEMGVGDRARGQGSSSSLSSKHWEGMERHGMLRS